MLILFKSRLPASHCVFLLFSFLLLRGHTHTHTYTDISIHIATTESGLIEKHLLRMLRSALLAGGEDKGCYIIQGTWPFKAVHLNWVSPASVSFWFDWVSSCGFLASFVSVRLILSDFLSFGGFFLWTCKEPAL